MAPPRNTGQLDQISQAIGRLEGMVEGIEKYNHEREHGIRDMTQAVNGVGALVTREVSRMKAEIQVQLDAITVRVTKLESARVGDERIRSVWLEILKSPIVAGIIGGIMSALALAWAFFSGPHR